MGQSTWGPPSRLDAFHSTLSNSNRHNAWRRTHRTQEAQPRARRHRRQEGGVPRRAHEASLGLHQEEQPAGSRQQAVLHPRQEDGQGLRLVQDARLRHGQAHRAPPILRLNTTPDATTYLPAAFLYQVLKYKINLADKNSIERRCFSLGPVTAIKCE